MKKSDIKIDGQYAVHHGYGKAKLGNCRKAEVIEFDWQEPEPEKEANAGYSSLRWTRTHTGTRVKFLDKTDHYIYGKKGSETAIPNRDVFMPWDEYEEKLRVSNVFDEYGKAYRRAKNDRGKVEDEAWTHFLKAVGLDDMDYVYSTGYRGPSVEDWIVLFRALGLTGDAEREHEAVVEFEETVYTAGRAQAEAMVKAIEKREKKLAALAVEYDRTDYTDEEREWLGLPIEDEDDDVIEIVN